MASLQPLSTEIFDPHNINATPPSLSTQTSSPSGYIQAVAWPDSQVLQGSPTICVIEQGRKWKNEIRSNPPKHRRTSPSHGKAAMPTTCSKNTSMPPPTQVRIPPKDSKGKWRVVSHKGKTVQDESSLCLDPMLASPFAAPQVGLEIIATIGTMETNEVINSFSSHSPNSSNRLTGFTSIGPVLKDPDP
ncbi:hypothetical protein F0562_007637 [Nyssa sinensis]|uniref:Uncharacterized protein n=1 Tax=Nyssa sinensis TaxID=561372 RepID=A0A5J5A7D8_9ASTE|nr:hypothetical protein F0562_007637 [Nyssa sinensis]